MVPGFTGNFLLGHPLVSVVNSNIEIQLEDLEDKALLLWPLTVVHVINEESPFWMISPEDLSSSSFEVIATLDFVAESTGITSQARTSYLPSEILWGFRSDIHIIM